MFIGSMEAKYFGGVTCLPNLLVCSTINLLFLVSPAGIAFLPPTPLSVRNLSLASRLSQTDIKLYRKNSLDFQVKCHTSLVPRPSYHGVPVRGPGNSGLRMRLIKTARYA